MTTDALTKPAAEEGSLPAEAEESFQCCKDFFTYLATSKHESAVCESFICGECGTAWQLMYDFSGVAIGWKKVERNKISQTDIRVRFAKS